MNLPGLDLQSPIIVALDVDSSDECLRLAKALKNKAGAFKIGPRLCMRYGSSLVTELSKFGPVFVDNKYLDIPNTMEHAVRATFESGATFTTIHTWAGLEALKRLGAVEKELAAKRPFRLLAVTILTSFTSETLPPGFESESVTNAVTDLSKLAIGCGLRGIVCSPHEVGIVRNISDEAFIVTPGVRLDTESNADQKRVLTPAAAIAAGSSALVIGRPIVDAKDPVEAMEKIIASIAEAKSQENK
ncbi:MAG: orotidine-5'-phosphate decarboxylase [Bdellovibrionota bacterium]